MGLTKMDDMGTLNNVKVVKDFFAAFGRSDRQALRALVADDIEWIIPGEAGRWPERTAEMPESQTCFRRRPMKWR
ncbi:hypothetical protein BH09PSE5_BH09PSE5_45070 [soil metagenome]